MATVGQCRGWKVETALSCQWPERCHLFPHIPEHSGFNRCRRNFRQAINDVRRGVLQLRDRAHDRHCTIHSLPVPVVQFHLVPGALRVGSAWGGCYRKGNRGEHEAADHF